jgi:hypothetical protein
MDELKVVGGGFKDLPRYARMAERVDTLVPHPADGERWRFGALPVPSDRPSLIARAGMISEAKGSGLVLLRDGDALDAARVEAAARYESSVNAIRDDLFRVNGSVVEWRGRRGVSRAVIVCEILSRWRSGLDVTCRLAMADQWNLLPFAELDDIDFVNDSLALVEAELRCVAARREERGDVAKVPTPSPVEESRSIAVVEQQAATLVGEHAAVITDCAAKRKKDPAAKRAPQDFVSKVRHALHCAVHLTGDEIHEELGPFPTLQVVRRYLSWMTGDGTLRNDRRGEGYYWARDGHMTIVDGHIQGQHESHTQAARKSA